MKLVKTSLFSAAITLVRTISGFVSTKFVAIYAGPGGVALVGQFVNFITISLAFANGAINTGVVKYTAEYEHDEEKTKTLFSNALKISLVCSVTVGICLVIFSSFLSMQIFKTPQYRNPVIALGAGLVLYALNTLFISILNGRKQIRDFTIVNITGSLLSLLFTIVLAHQFRLVGALYALALAQSVNFFITFFMLIKSPWIKKSYFTRKADKDMLKKLGSYSLMAMVTALTVPVAQLLLRGIIIKNVSVESAGYWQGMARISDAYLLILTTAISTYFLPKLSSINNDYALKKEILSGYKIILPFTVACSIMIYLLRYFIIKILYTPDFNAMQSLFPYQMVSDCFKISSWMLAILMPAKAMTKAYIISEICFSAFYVLLASFFIRIMGVRGVVMASALNYIIYFIVMLILFRRLLFKKHEIHEDIAGR